MSENHGGIFSEKRFRFFRDVYLRAIVFTNGTQYLAVDKKLPDGSFKNIDMLQCIHTVIYSGTPEEIDRMMSERPMELISTEGQQIDDLQPGDKTLAFASWVQGIAEFGIGAIKLQMEMDSLVASRQVPISRFLIKSVIKANPEYIVPLWDATIEPCFYEGAWVKSCVSANLNIIAEALRPISRDEETVDLFLFIVEKLEELVSENAVHIEIVMKILGIIGLNDERVKAAVEEFYRLIRDKIVRIIVNKLRHSEIDLYDFPEIAVIFDNGALESIYAGLEDLAGIPADSTVEALIKFIDKTEDERKKRLTLAAIVFYLRSVKSKKIYTDAVDTFIEHLKGDTGATEKMIDYIIKTLASTPEQNEIYRIDGEPFIKAPRYSDKFIKDLHDLLYNSAQKVISGMENGSLEPIKRFLVVLPSPPEAILQYPVVKALIEHPEKFGVYSSEAMLSTVEYRWLDIIYTPVIWDFYPESRFLYLKVDRFLIRVLGDRIDPYTSAPPSSLPDTLDRYLIKTGETDRPEKIFLAYHVFGPSLRPPPESAIAAADHFYIKKYIATVEFCKPNVEDIVRFIGPSFTGKVEEIFRPLVTSGDNFSDIDMAFIYAVAKHFPEIAESVPIGKFALIPAVIMTLATGSEEYLRKFTAAHAEYLRRIKTAEIKNQLIYLFHVLTEGRGIPDNVDRLIPERKIIHNPTLLGFYLRFTDASTTVTYSDRYKLAKIEASGSAEGGSFLRIIVRSPDDPAGISVFPITSPALLLFGINYKKILDYYLKASIGYRLYYGIYRLSKMMRI